MDFSIEILDADVGNTALFTISDGSVAFEVLAEVIFEGSVGTLRNVHVQGSGANSVGPARLIRLCRPVREPLGVQELRVEGATRTSGSGPGRRPRALVFR